MKILKYVKWLLVSLVIITFIACGSSSDGGGDNTEKIIAEEPQVELSYPDDGDILIRFVQTNGDAQGEYVLENEDGESEWSGTVEGVEFSVTSIDYFPNEIVIGNSNATFTYNGDDTFNYEIYIDGELIDEEYSVTLSSLELSSPARTISRASEEECEAKRGDIAIYYKFLVGRALEIEEKYDKCIEKKIEYTICHSEYPGGSLALNVLVRYIINSSPGIAKLVEDYKSSCLGTAVDDVIEEEEENPQIIIVSDTTCPIQYVGGYDPDGDHFYILREQEEGGVYSECLYYSSQLHASKSYDPTSGALKWTYQDYYEDGTPGETSHWIGDIPVGYMVEHYSNGVIWIEGTYVNGEKDGEFTTYREESGNIWVIETYSNGEFVSKVIYDEDENLVYAS